MFLLCSDAKATALKRQLEECSRRVIEEEQGVHDDCTEELFQLLEFVNARRF
ncbi:hypothetical protein BG015_011885 [Linnemannia schmuckeri]|uniref:Ubiquinol-cytochrome C reductase hinge domain-containing protein n=1 Tax=Linnemannia schmuckeri TaxID=64567 RepID=A0A9P5V7V7_9FUNG|nr:hypothetical protein BG015_011885 [Linnemannia schmuckeri]